MGFWRKTVTGHEYSCPSRETGIHIDGPLSAEDLKEIIGDLLNELVEQTKREAQVAGGEA